MPHRKGYAIITAVALSACALTLAASASAATFKVTRADDPSPGACGLSDCSLREAVLAANGAAGADTIVLRGRTYELTRPPAEPPADPENDAETGDLNVDGALAVRGDGPASTTIKAAWASGNDRMVEVLPGAKLTASGLTLRDGDDGTYAASGIHVREPTDAPAAKLVLEGVNLKSMNSGYAVDNYGAARLERVRFIGNSAGSGCCAGFYNEPGSTVKMTDVVFSGNEAVQDTGAMYSDGDRAVLKNVTFANNTAGNVGGAMVASGVDQTLVNVTFVGNENIQSGGALEVEPVNSLLLNNVTFTRNVADSDEAGGGDGGAVHISGGPLTLQNTIVAGNEDRSPSGSVHPDCSGSFTSNGYNLFGIDNGCNFSPATGDASGTSATPLDPNLGTLGDNGGFVPTVPLLAGSPAINRGSPADPGGSNQTACAARDARLVKRPQGPRCDKGAFERMR